MEFYVVDPKTDTYEAWQTRIRQFLSDESFSFTESPGELYFVGDDIAVPWDEESILFTIPGDDGGVIELRGTDNNFYVFADDLDLFDEKEVRDSVGFIGRTMGALFGFEWASKGSCRFHKGPSFGCNYFCVDDKTDVPPQLHLEDVWAQFFRSVYWLGGNTSRLQDLKGINVEKVYLDFEVDVSFTHPASLESLFEILVDEDKVMRYL